MKNSNYSSLYIHVPFCKEKCAYCAFYSIDSYSKEKIDIYLKNLEKEFIRYSPRADKLQSVFIGGGTPTLLPVKSLDKLFSLINKYFSFEKGFEFTIESNPETLNKSKIEFLASSPINRISIGIQSFDPVLRKTIGRKGSIKNINEKINSLHKQGIKNINVDFIYNIPGQSLTMWGKDLLLAAKLPITHLSAYNLTYEEKARLTKEHLDEDLSIEMWKLTNKLLSEKSQIKRYEVSNYAKKGFECKHNLSFWQGSTYLGCGPGAVSFDGETRRKNPENLNKWLKNKDIKTWKISKEDRSIELLILGLRTTKGIKHENIKNIETLIQQELKLLIEEKLISFNGKVLKPTQKGLLFGDYIASLLI